MVRRVQLLGLGPAVILVVLLEGLGPLVMEVLEIPLEAEHH